MPVPKTKSYIKLNSECKTVNTFQYIRSGLYTKLQIGSGAIKVIIKGKFIALNSFLHKGKKKNYEFTFVFQKAVRQVENQRPEYKHTKQCDFSP